MAKFTQLTRFTAKCKTTLRTLFIGAFVTAGLASLSACSYLEPYKAPTVQGNIMTPESVNLLQVGLTQGQVRELLGPPMGSNPFNPLHWEYIYYSTAETKNKKRVRKHLVLNFDQNKFLSNWKQQDLQVELKEDKSWLGLGWF
ncbi:outer membrane protein assembly factor BamE [Thiomicrorhabdus sediminis]|uniref:Outer membrane protein assembly factor BamE n=1 Tax=Thiomicrorhabdus sediminis TaxID=2580412 RepID=A0A4V1HHR7_9GAMM|nr:outer membrane protein assembly factor BamE [Thiomicrorhabdus sediminis]QCU89963.1 outer membrane protein assembly factor BamE [Thiomicrorhabdus sediminis]